mmetsp:Transcript_485/g.1131  ORF Transcript_485/g.1131 Transcript_485/m.1131 type:complete len:204 (-) Transcript_485:676-1287(-)
MGGGDYPAGLGDRRRLHRRFSFVDASARRDRAHVRPPVRQGQSRGTPGPVRGRLRSRYRLHHGPPVLPEGWRGERARLPRGARRRDGRLLRAPAGRGGSPDDRAHARTNVRAHVCADVSSHQERTAVLGARKRPSDAHTNERDTDASPDGGAAACANVRAHVTSHTESVGAIRGAPQHSSDTHAHARTYSAAHNGGADAGANT